MSLKGRGVKSYGVECCGKIYSPCLLRSHRPIRLRLSSHNHHGPRLSRKACLHGRCLRVHPLLGRTIQRPCRHCPRSKHQACQLLRQPSRSSRQIMADGEIKSTARGTVSLKGRGVKSYGVECCGKIYSPCLLRSHRPIRLRLSSHNHHGPRLSRKACLHGRCLRVHPLLGRTIQRPCRHCPRSKHQACQLLRQPSRSSRQIMADGEIKSTARGTVSLKGRGVK